MGRLFWKFFLMVWLAQATAVVATSAYFWHERPPHPHAPPRASHRAPRRCRQSHKRPREKPGTLFSLIVGLTTHYLRLKISKLKIADLKLKISNLKHPGRSG